MATIQPVKTSVWNQIFPTTVSDEKTSVKLVKKMVALGVSNIAYLRFNIPEEAFVTVDLEGLNVKILRMESGNEAVTEIVRMIRWATDALDKGYLKELIISVNTGNPEDVFEAYSFTFNYTEKEDDQKGPDCTSSNRHNIPIDGASCAKDLQTTARNMIRRIILLTQDLENLPKDAYLDVKICYHVGVTPDDYQVRGFEPMDLNRIQNFRKSLVALPSLTSGKVSSSWHEVSGLIRSKAWLPEHLSFINKVNEGSQLSQYFPDNSQSSDQRTYSQNQNVMSQENIWQSKQSCAGARQTPG